MQHILWPFLCLHSESTGSGNSPGMYGPDPAVPQAKIQIKSSSAPCPGTELAGEHLCSPMLRGSRVPFQGLVLHQQCSPFHRQGEGHPGPAWDTSPAFHLQAERGPRATAQPGQGHPTMPPPDKADLPAAMLGWGIPSTGAHPFPTASSGAGGAAHFPAKQQGVEGFNLARSECGEGRLYK